MRAHSRSTSIYLGRKAGARLLDDIRNAKQSVKIVSPYLSPGYVEELIRLKQRGIEVTLITSDSIPEGDGVYSSLTHKDLIRQERITDAEALRKRTQGLRHARLSFLLPVAYYLLPLDPVLFWPMTVFSLASSIIAHLHFHSIRVFSYRYFPLFNLRVFHSPYNGGVRGEFFVHSKAYVIDHSIAYLGSVNFTRGSLWNNYECVARVEDTEAVRSILGEVENLFDSKELYFRPVEAWGRELYAEPPC